MSVFGVILVPIFPHSDIFRILRISPYSVRMRENADQNNSQYGQFHAVMIITITMIIKKNEKIVSASKKIKTTKADILDDIRRKQWYIF